MKKNNFVNGAFIATFGIVICKILGLVYVIPFYKIIGTQGGALYSYAYSIYAVFLNLSTAGIPMAISKIVSEYNALNQEKLQKRAFKIASKLLNIVGLIAFALLFVFSDLFARLIIGGVEGGNTVADVSIAIKTVSLALIVVPQLSILRGYFQGNRYITQSSLSSVIEQLVRVIIIIFGSYISVKVFGLPVKIAVYISILGATIGALTSYIYLKIKIRKHKNDFSTEKTTSKELKVDNKMLLKKIVCYAIPFVIINLLQSAYSVVDTFTVVKTMTSLGYPTAVAETTIGVLNTWGSKLNMIVVSISLGLIVSLVPNVTASYAKNDFKDINNKVNQSIKMLLFITLPMAIGISILSAPIWNVFYGYDKLSVSIFSIFILQVVFYSVYITLINVTQAMNQTKLSLGVLSFSFILKVILNIPMMRLLSFFNIEAYYGPTITNALIELTSLTIILIILHKKYKFSYKDLISPFFKILFCLGIMILSLVGMKYLYFSIDSIASSILTIVLFVLVGALIYFSLAFKLKLIDNIFGPNLLENLIGRLPFKKKGGQK